jgi:hypothetical protein
MADEERNEMGAPYDRAIEETAKTLGKITEAASALGQFTAKVFGGSIQELAGWSREVIAIKRLQWNIDNLQSVIQKFAALKSSLENLRPLPARQSVVVLEAIANEDNEDLQLLWVRLLNSATDPKMKYEIKRAHIDVLRSIDPIEAKILAAVAEALTHKEAKTQLIPGKDLSTAVGLDDAQLTLYLHHLASLGCFNARANAELWASESSPEPPTTIETQTSEFQVTSLLTSLLEAVC